MADGVGGLVGVCDDDDEGLYPDQANGRPSAVAVRELPLVMPSLPYGRMRGGDDDDEE